MDYFAELDRLIECPVYVIDYLPGPVPASRGRHYWKVEKWFPSRREYKRLYRKFLRLLLKLSCYCEFTVSYGPKWEENPSPKRLERLVEKCTGSRKDYLNILIDQGRAMVILNGDDLYLSVYDPDLRLRQLLGQLAASEGLFLWKPQPNPEA